MNRFYENTRKFKRFSLPVALNIPGFLDLPLIPEDLSAGGIMVVVYQEPDAERFLDCTMLVTGDAEFKCRAQVAWERDNGTDPASWSVGLKLKLGEEEQKMLESHVRNLVSEYWGAQAGSSPA